MSHYSYFTITPTKAPARGDNQARAINEVVNVFKLGQRCAVNAENIFLRVVYGIRKLKLAEPEGSCGNCTPPPLMEPMVDPTFDGRRVTGTGIFGDT